MGLFGSLSCSLSRERVWIRSWCAVVCANWVRFGVLTWRVERRVCEASMFYRACSGVLT